MTTAKFMRPTAQKLIALNPLLAKKDINELENLITAFLECEYEWNEEEHYFLNTNLGTVVRASKMEVFTAESIRNKWGNKDYLREDRDNKFFARIGCISFLAIPVALLIAGVYDWKIGLSLACFAGVTLWFSDKKKMIASDNKGKIDGTYIDTDKIIWCKKCVHFRKIKKWSYEICGQSSIPEYEKIPCKIVDETIATWGKYFSMEKGSRTLYPNDCPQFIKK